LHGERGNWEKGGLAAGGSHGAFLELTDQLKSCKPTGEGSAKGLRKKGKECNYTGGGRNVTRRKKPIGVGDTVSLTQKEKSASKRRRVTRGLEADKEKSEHNSIA